jgi:hypothetical protein
MLNAAVTGMFSMCVTRRPRLSALTVHRAVCGARSVVVADARHTVFLVECQLLSQAKQRCAMGTPT